LFILLQTLQKCNILKIQVRNHWKTKAGTVPIVVSKKQVPFNKASILSLPSLISRWCVICSEFVIMAEQSPEWKKPSDVMKLRRRSSLGQVSCKAVSVSASHLQQSSGDFASDRKSQKRKNPFASSQVNIRSGSAIDAEELLTSGADVSITNSNSVVIDCQRGSSQLNKILVCCVASV